MTIEPEALRQRSTLRGQLEARVRGKAMPVGALGRLEELAVQIGLVTGSLTPALGLAKIVVFAGDHGITSEGVTAYPSAVTREIAKLILAGTAGINVCARGVNADVILVDAGLLEALEPHENLITRRIASGTANAHAGPAMTDAQRDAALAAGRDIVTDLVRSGTQLLAFGEVGIGNTSASALLAHAVTGIALNDLIGNGAGAPALGLDHKRRILSETYERAGISGETPAARARAALSAFSGFEMVMMAGAFAAAADQGCVIIVDGFIATAVAAAACALQAEVRAHCVFAHCSADAGHRALLNHLEAKPLLDLGLRLGEGTGAALAIPLVRAAEAMLRDMADLPGGPPS